MARCGRKKGALFKLDSSELAELVEGPDVAVCVGSSRESREREKNDCWGGGGFLRIDFPGRGRVTADDDGEVEDAGDCNAIRTVTMTLLPHEMLSCHLSPWIY